MEALEADDISPALEATEEFFLFSGIDDQVGHNDLPKQEVFGIQEVPVIVGHDVLQVKGERSHKTDGTRITAQKMSKSEYAKKLEFRRNAPTSKPVGVANGPTQQWTIGADTEGSFISNSYGAVHSKIGSLPEEWSPSWPLAVRSQSDIVPSRCKSQSGPVPAHYPLDSDIPPSRISFSSSFSKGGNFAMVSQSQDNRQPLGRDVIKKGSLARRQDHASLWKECYVELCPRELCLYSVATGDDSHLCNVYYLSHCQSITLSISHGDHVLEVLFSNGAPLQLQARSREEAEEWRQDLLAQMLALSLPNRTQTPPPTDWHPGTCQVKTIQPAAVQLRPEGTVRIGVLHMLMPQNNWNSYTFVLSQSQLKYFRTNDLQEEPLASYRINQCLNIRFEVTVESTPRLKVSFPEEVLILMADSQQETQEWMEAIKAMINSKRVANSSKCFSVSDQKAKGLDCSDGGTKRNKRYSVTSSFLSLLTVIAVEKGLTAQSFRCAGCQRPVGLSYGNAKVCAYSGWYYCQACHVDDVFLIPARLVHNWDTTKHKVSKQAKEFLEYISEEPLVDVRQDNPHLYEHVEALATVLRLRQQLKSLRAYLFSCRASVAEDLRRRIFPREYILQHVHLYSLADLQQVRDTATIRSNFLVTACLKIIQSVQIVLYRLLSLLC
ncbi:pleckstrin homology domain-containing family M member 3 [Rhincodon typus]|uniref:pleckstrin homology domain-containing family M member 3 n=1 Tax=Rhincodon typus TaxID=259920 RepID=UPI00202F6977|nr:pleckstrin homology domain-containing family M member 3 [Rhincodon typus]XP_048455512.1 pleckstrin homology domain-containing family M member 3 [Rhincodon typus]XP_048455513.1 pleckstrin homology domain-containing family M member 3 [Rhincodon typus]